MPRKSLANYIPTAARERLELKVPADLYQQVDQIRKQMGLTWISLATACFEKFVDDYKPKRVVLNEDEEKQTSFLERVDVEKAARIFTSASSPQQARIGSSPR